MSTFGKIALILLGLFLMFIFLPSLFISFEGAQHYVHIGGFTENLIGFAIATIVFFGLAALFISLFAGIFVVIAMIFGGMVLAGLSALWPIILVAVILYLIFAKKKKSDNY